MDHVSIDLLRQSSFIKANLIFTDWGNHHMQNNTTKYFGYYVPYLYVVMLHAKLYISDKRYTIIPFYTYTVYLNMARISVHLQEFTTTITTSVEANLKV